MNDERRAGTVTLEEKSVEDAIDLLSRAARTFEPTRVQRFLYQALLVSLDFALGGLVVLIIVLWTGLLTNAHFEYLGPEPNFVVLLVFILAISASFFAGAVGALLLFLNLPLFIRSWRQRLHLQRLGVADLSGSLEAIRRRRGWLVRFGNTLIAAVGLGLSLFIPGVFATVFSVGLMLGLIFSPDSIRADLGSLVFFVSVMLFAAWRLGRLRERLELATDLRELSDELKTFRDQVAHGVDFAFPRQLVERTAQVESAQIARERQEAIHKSINTGSIGVAVAFDYAALRQREHLGLAERRELEELVDSLSAKGIQAPGGAARTTTRNGAIEVDYVPDPPDGIRIAAIRNVSNLMVHAGDASDD